MTESSICYQCDNCGHVWNYDSEVCPSCGSKQQTITFHITEKSSPIIVDMLSAAVKEIGKKKPILEEKVGSEIWKDKGKYVTKKRIIDRENNHYYEKIVDPDTKEVIHECDEPLTEHFGHGSAKKEQK